MIKAEDKLIRSLRAISLPMRSYYLFIFSSFGENSDRKKSYCYFHAHSFRKFCFQKVFTVAKMKHRWFYDNKWTFKSVFKVIVGAAPSKGTAPTCSDLFTLKRIHKSFKVGFFWFKNHNYFSFKSALLFY